MTTAEAPPTMAEVDRLIERASCGGAVGVDALADLRAMFARAIERGDRLEKAIMRGARYDEPHAEPCFCNALTAQAIHSNWCERLRDALRGKP